MKCPTCGNGKQAPHTIGCRDCGKTWPIRCHHEPANFTVAESRVVYSLPPKWPSESITIRPNIDIALPYHVCRLCGVFYTDLDAVAEGEKKYQEAERSD